MDFSDGRPSRLNRSLTINVYIPRLVILCIFPYQKPCTPPKPFFSSTIKRKHFMVIIHTSRIQSTHHYMQEGMREVRCGVSRLICHKLTVGKNHLRRKIRTGYVNYIREARGSIQTFLLLWDHLIGQWYHKSRCKTGQTCTSEEQTWSTLRILFRL